MRAMFRLVMMGGAVAVMVMLVTVVKPFAVLK